MKYWKRRITALLTASLLVGNIGQSALPLMVYAEEPVDSGTILYNASESVSSDKSAVEEYEDDTLKASETDADEEQSSGEEVTEEGETSDDTESVNAGDTKWYEKYEYILYDDYGTEFYGVKGENVILPIKYKGTDQKIVVPAKATIDGMEYRTVISCDIHSNDENVNMGTTREESIFTANTRSVTFEEGVHFCDYALLFYNCYSLQEFDLGTFNSEIIDMSSMFDGCSSLKSIDMSKFDTSNVKYMAGMFSMCDHLTSLNLNGFRTDSATYMNNMFDNCSSLTSLDVSSFKTDNVMDMSNMFAGCSSLKSLDLSGFKTNNVEDIHGMFFDCKSLTSLDVSSFNTDKVTGMSSMFYGCRDLSSLDVSGFKTDNVTDMSSMFYGCSSLTNLDVSSFKTDKVRNMISMFEGCSSLASLDVSGFNTDNVGNMCSMFKDCSSLTGLDVGGFNTSGVVQTHYMFGGCSGLTGLDVSGFDMTKNEDMEGMFALCSGLKSLDLSSFDTSNVTSMDYMFYGCSNLTDLNLKGFDTSKVTTMNAMFGDCISLAELDVSGFKTDTVNSIKYMFGGCKALKSLDLSQWERACLGGEDHQFPGSFWKTITSNQTFAGCESLELILSPKAVTEGYKISLPGVYLDDEGTEYTALPYAGSVTLRRSGDYVPVEDQKPDPSASGSAMDSQPDLNASALYLVKGQRFTVPAGEWSCQPKNILAIKKNNVTVKSVGKAVLTGKSGDTEYSLEVTVIDPAFVILDEETWSYKKIKKLSMVVGDFESLNVLDAVEDPDKYDHYPVYYTSSKPEVVSAGDGYVRALAKGSAKITAYVNGKSYSCNVKVSDVDKKAAVLNVAFDGKVELKPLQTANLKIPGFSFKTADWKVKYDYYGEMEELSTIDKKTIGNSIIRISNSGKITAVGKGSCYLEGKDKRGQECSFWVDVYDSQEKIYYVNTGASKNISFYGFKADKASWSVTEGSEYVKVDAKGRVTAGNTGGQQCVITASYDPYGTGGFEFKAWVVIIDTTLKTSENLKSVKGDRYELNLLVGESLKLEFPGSDSLPVLFKSSKNSVAFVDEYGKVTARGIGKCNIKGKLNGKSISIAVVVK